MNGISSSRNAPSGLPAFVASSCGELVGVAPRCASASRSSASARSPGVVVAQPAEARARGRHGAVDVLARADSGACGDLLAGGRVEDRLGLAAGRVDGLAVDEVGERREGGGHARERSCRSRAWQPSARCRLPMLEQSPSPRRAGVPVPPIKEYAFLSDCHTGALLAPDGTVEWLCVPRFDAPSIFGVAAGPRRGRVPARALRESASPAARRYEPGTNILETTWMTPTGWSVVREALSIGPWRDVEDQVTPHTRPPVDQDATHVLVRTIECVQGTVDARAHLRAAVRLRAHAGRVVDAAGCLRPGRRHRRRPEGAPDHRHAPGHRGQPGAGAPPR